MEALLLQRLYHERRAEQARRLAVQNADYHWTRGDGMAAQQAALMQAQMQRDLAAYQPAPQPAARAAANSKSLALLKEWLSPDQLAQYEKSGFFDVTGSLSGRRYRIREGRQQNVYRLENEREMHGLCFVPDPEQTRTIGDVMLAQKIALETDEVAALEVAAVFPVYVGASQQPLAQGGLASQSYNSLFGGPPLF
jgi:hypothetical protein